MAAKEASRPNTWVPTWENVAEKPNEFIPTEHSHTTKQVEGLTDALNGKTNKSVALSRTITSAWMGDAAPYTQIISVAGVTATSIVEVSLPPTATVEQVEAFQNLNLQDGGQSIDSITLRAFGEKNAVNVPIRIIVRGDM